MIVVAGYPRSGTNLLHFLLASCLDEPVAKIHFSYQLVNYESPSLIHIVRNPKDVAVSAYFFYMHFFAHHQGHTLENWPFSSFLRGQFANGYVGNGHDGCPMGWKETTEIWLAIPTVATITYEELRDNRTKTLKGILKRFGPTDKWKIAQAIEVSRKVHRASYVTGELVKAGASEWKDFFGHEDMQFLEDYAGHLMARLGYGKDTT